MSEKSEPGIRNRICSRARVSRMIGVPMDRNSEWKYLPVFWRRHYNARCKKTASHGTHKVYAKAIRDDVSMRLVNVQCHRENVDDVEWMYRDPYGILCWDELWRLHHPILRFVLYIYFLVNVRFCDIKLTLSLVFRVLWIKWNCISWYILNHYFNSWKFINGFNFVRRTSILIRDQFVKDGFQRSNSDYKKRMNFQL